MGDWCSKADIKQNEDSGAAKKGNRSYKSAKVNFLRMD